MDTCFDKSELEKIPVHQTWCQAARISICSWDIRGSIPLPTLGVASNLALHANYTRWNHDTHDIPHTGENPRLSGREFNLKSHANATPGTVERDSRLPSTSDEVSRYTRTMSLAHFCIISNDIVYPMEWLACG